MGRITQTDLSAGQCAEYLAYDTLTGILTWRALRPHTRFKIGDQAGLLHKDGYRYLTLYGRMRLVHRVVWLMTFGEWPAGYIDHINRVRDDNRISNLRLATPSESSRNTSSRRGSSSQFLGVCKNRSGWQATIRMKGRGAIYLGTFPTEIAAADAYATAARELFGAFAGEITQLAMGA